MITSTDMRPTFNFLLSHPAHVIALGFGSGLSPRAPGTMGSLLAWMIYPLIKTPVSDTVFVVFLAVFFVLGVIVCERAGKALGVSDHGAIVWDEIVAVWLVLLFAPATLAWQAVAVALFRFFDIVKPQPIGWADRRLKGGFGVMFDDILAAGYALLALAVLVHFFGATPWMMI